jgi:ferredoxin
MSHVISSECVSCGACASECPVDAIVQGDPIYEINSDCIDCGVCVSSCPVDAISAG